MKTNKFHLCKKIPYLSIIDMKSKNFF